MEMKHLARILGAAASAAPDPGLRDTLRAAANAAEAIHNEPKPFDYAADLQRLVKLSGEPKPGSDITAVQYEDGKIRPLDYQPSISYVTEGHVIAGDYPVAAVQHSDGDARYHRAVVYFGEDADAAELFRDWFNREWLRGHSGIRPEDVPVRDTALQPELPASLFGLSEHTPEGRRVFDAYAKGGMGAAAKAYQDIMWLAREARQRGVPVDERKPHDWQPPKPGDLFTAVLGDEGDPEATQVQPVLPDTPPQGTPLQEPRDGTSPPERHRHRRPRS